MTISVIIPTYNRLQVLLQALRSLQEQTLPDFEILVVDNAADSAVEQVVAEFSERATVPIRYVPEPQIGLHNARHAGVHTATGDLLVFTDDDATFAPAWLEAYAEAFAEHTNMAAAGGPVRPMWESPPPKWLLDFMGAARTFGILSLMEPYEAFRLDVKGFFFGVNMAIRRDVLFEVNGFNPDSFGDIWLGDGESGLNRKIWNLGLPVGYVPDALVYHHIPSSRMTPAYFRQRQANQGATMAYTRYHEGIPAPICLMTRIARIAVRNLPQWMMAPFLWNRTSRMALNAQIRTAQSLSEIGYILRLMREPNFRLMVTRKDWMNGNVNGDSKGC